MSFCWPWNLIQKSFKWWLVLNSSIKPQSHFLSLSSATTSPFLFMNIYIPSLKGNKSFNTVPPLTNRPAVWFMMSPYSATISDKRGLELVKIKSMRPKKFTANTEIFKYLPQMILSGWCREVPYKILDFFFSNFSPNSIQSFQSYLESCPLSALKFCPGQFNFLHVFTHTQQQTLPCCCETHISAISKVSVLHRMTISNWAASLVPLLSSSAKQNFHIILLCIWLD